MVTRMQRVSVSVDSAMLRELRRLAGEGERLSVIFDKALRVYTSRLALIAQIDEEKRKMSVTEQAAAQSLWPKITSSSIPAPSQRWPKKKVARGKRSAMRSQQARKSSSPRS